MKCKISLLLLLSAISSQAFSWDWDNHSFPGYDPDFNLAESSFALKIKNHYLGADYISSSGSTRLSFKNPKYDYYGSDKIVLLQRYNKHFAVVTYGYAPSRKGGIGPAQRWDWQPLRKRSCLNAYKPRQGSVVNLYRCNRNDPEQTWEIINPKYDATNSVQIRKSGTNLCLNSYKTSHGSQLNLWTCNFNDPDQWFSKDNREVIAGP